MQLEFDPLSIFVAPGVQAFILSDHDYSPQQGGFIDFIQIQSDVDVIAMGSVADIDELTQPDGRAGRGAEVFQCIAFQGLYTGVPDHGLAIECACKAQSTGAVIDLFIDNIITAGFLELLLQLLQ